MSLFLFFSLSLFLTPFYFLASLCILPFSLFSFHSLGLFLPPLFSFSIFLSTQFVYFFLPFSPNSSLFHTLFLCVTCSLSTHELTTFSPSILLSTNHILSDTSLGFCCSLRSTVAFPSSFLSFFDRKKNLTVCVTLERQMNE